MSTHHSDDHDASTPDFDTWHDGSLIHATALTQEAHDWLDGNVEFEEWQHLGTALIMDGRAGVDVLYAAIDAGLVIRDTSTGRRAGRS